VKKAIPSWFELSGEVLSGEVGDDQHSEHQKPQPLNEAAEIVADGGLHFCSDFSCTVGRPNRWGV
jgi:hypothetical protein